MSYLTDIPRWRQLAVQAIYCTSDFFLSIRSPNVIQWEHKQVKADTDITKIPRGERRVRCSSRRGISMTSCLLAACIYAHGDVWHIASALCESKVRTPVSHDVRWQMSCNDSKEVFSVEANEIELLHKFAINRKYVLMPVRAIEAGEDHLHVRQCTRYLWRVMAEWRCHERCVDGQSHGHGVEKEEDGTARWNRCAKWINKWYFKCNNEWWLFVCIAVFTVTAIPIDVAEGMGDSMLVLYLSITLITFSLLRQKVRCKR